MGDFLTKTREVVIEILAKHGELSTKELLHKVQARGPYSTFPPNEAKERLIGKLKTIGCVKVRYDKDTGNHWSLKDESDKPAQKFKENDAPLVDAITGLLASGGEYTVGQIAAHVAAQGYQLPDKARGTRISNLMRKMVALELAIEGIPVKSKHGDFINTYRGIKWSNQTTLNG